jgi:hypothetical protein
MTPKTHQRILEAAALAALALSIVAAISASVLLLR